MQVEIPFRMKKVFTLITLLSFKQKDLSGFYKKKPTSSKIWHSANSNSKKINIQKRSEFEIAYTGRFLCGQGVECPGAALCGIWPFWILCHFYGGQHHHKTVGTGTATETDRILP
jgi:hypothetical protein